MTCVLGVGLLLAIACNRNPQTPAAAYQKLAQAVADRDPEALFDALDQETRWSWMTVQRCNREAYDIVLSSFPQGADRESNLGHFETGALATSVAELFAARAGAEALRDLTARLPGAQDTQPTTAGPDAATVPDRNGAPLLFRLLDGRWGYAGFRDAADQLKKRAVADLELIQRSATDYERAAIRRQP